MVRLESHKARRRAALNRARDGTVQRAAYQRMTRRELPRFLTNILISRRRHDELFLVARDKLHHPPSRPTAVALRNVSSTISRDEIAGN